MSTRTTNKALATGKALAADKALAIVCGMGAQATWWTFSTAAPRFAALMPDLVPAFYIGLVFGSVGIVYALLPFFVHPIARMKLWTGAKASAIVQTIFMISTVLVLYVGHIFGETPHDQQHLLVVVCILFAFATLASFKCQEALNGITSEPSVDLVGSIWLGGTTSALVMGVLQVVLKVTKCSERTQGILFFTTGCVISLASVISMVALQRRLAKRLGEQTSTDIQQPENHTQRSMVTWDHFAIATTETEPLLSASSVQLTCSAPSSDDEQRSISVSTTTKSTGHAGLDHPSHKEKALNVVRAMPQPYFVMAMDLFYLMCLYPGVLSVLHGRGKSDGMFAVILLCAFNAGDCFGKALPPHLPWLSSAPKGSRRLIYGLVSEVCVFAPLFILSTQMNDLQHDVLAYVLAFCMACAHGYISVSCYKAVTSRMTLDLPDESHQTIAGEMNFVMSCVGIGTGAMVAIGLSYSPLVKA